MLLPRQIQRPRIMSKFFAVSAVSPSLRMLPILVPHAWQVLLTSPRESVPKSLCTNVKVVSDGIRTLESGWPVAWRVAN